MGQCIQAKCTQINSLMEQAHRFYNSTNAADLEMSMLSHTMTNMQTEFQNVRASIAVL